MTNLSDIKRHLDAHEIGSAIIGDHVAIGVVWTTKTLDGRERKREFIERVHSFEEACGVIGCWCAGAQSAA